MCGRLSLHDLEAVRVLADLLRIPQGQIDLSGIQPRYNTQPTHLVPVIVDNGGTRAIGTMVWGWKTRKALHDGRSARHINARSETVVTLPTFQKAARQQRCVIVANGYFEWERDFQDRPLAPHYIHPSHQSWLAIAGIYQLTVTEHRECALLTMQPNQSMARIHDRMPCILDLDGIDGWLRADTPERANNILRPIPEDYLTENPVSERVNKVSNEGPDLIEPAKANPRQSDWISDR